VANNDTDSLYQIDVSGLSSIAKNNEYSGTIIDIYPNPSKSNVQIRYQVKGEGNIICDLYHTSGIKIKQLINAEKKPGDYKIKIDVSKLSPGIYLISFEAGINRKTEKIIIQ